MGERGGERVRGEGGYDNDMVIMITNEWTYVTVKQSTALYCIVLYCIVSC